MSAFPLETPTFRGLYLQKKFTVGWNLTSCARSHLRWIFFLPFYKIREKKLFEESSYKSTNKNSSILALILLDVKKPCFFLYSVTIKCTTKSCSEEGINHYTIKGNETLIYGPLDAFSLQDCQCFALPQVILRDLWLTWNKAPKAVDSVWKKCFLGSFRRTKHWRQSCPEIGVSARNSAFWFLPQASQKQNLNLSFLSSSWVIQQALGFGILLNCFLICMILLELAMVYAVVNKQTKRDLCPQTCRHQVSESKLIFFLNLLRFVGAQHWTFCFWVCIVSELRLVWLRVCVCSQFLQCLLHFEKS